MKNTFLLLLLVSSTVTAQVSYVGVNGNFNTTFRTIQAESNSDVQWIVDLREGKERPIFSYSAGFMGGHRFANNLILETGAQYSRFGFEMPNLVLIGSDGKIVSTQNKTTEISHYAGIPLRVGYSFRLNDKFRLNFIVGADANFFLARTFKSNIQWDDGSNSKYKDTYTKNTGYARFLLMGCSNLGIEYAWNQKLLFRIAPSFRYALTPVVNAPIKERPYSMGFELGMGYFLRSNN